MPIVLRSTPATVNHAWRVPPVSGRGKPEAKPSKSIAAMRRVVKMSRYDILLGRSEFGVRSSEFFLIFYLFTESNIIITRV
jgi:hypothetical protein